jgi:hypothetical protein
MSLACSIDASKRTSGRSLKKSTTSFSWRQQRSTIIREIPGTEEDAGAEVAMITKAVVEAVVALSSTVEETPGLSRFRIRGLKSQMTSSPLSTHTLSSEISSTSRMLSKELISLLLNTSRLKMCSLNFLPTNSQSTWKTEIASKRRRVSISSQVRASLPIWARPTTLGRRKRPSKSTLRGNPKK